MIGFLLAAPLALAESSTQLGGYPRGGVAGGAESQGRGEAVVTGQLPFTGLNLVLLVVGGTLLIALGVALTLRGRSRNAAG